MGCVDIIILRSYPTLVSVVNCALVQTVSPLLELYFVLVAYSSGWRENQKEALCSGQFEQKKKRQDDTASSKKKLWRFCLTRFERNLKRKKEVKYIYVYIEPVDRFEAEFAVTNCLF